MTEARIKPCIVAVSGGVDSVVMLDRLMADDRPLIVAHVNHGIRADSDDDEVFVEQLAKSYGVPFVSTQLHLGVGASEETARNARYAWLEQIRVVHDASAIATAHHQDDVLETIVINLERGTGWRGLCSLRNTLHRQRPLLEMSKAEIVAYAIEHNLIWREDSTNGLFHYLRNRIRHDVIPRFSPAERQKLLELYSSQLALRQTIDTAAQTLYESFCQDTAILRHPLIMIDEASAFEILRAWLGESLEKSRLHDLLTFSKTAQNGAKWSLDTTRFIAADKTRLIVLSPRG